MANPTRDMSPEQAQAALRTLLEGPAMSPPAGVVPNLHDPANLDVYVALTITLCVAFATVAVLLRMYTKVFILRALAWEDYVIVLAWLLQIGETIPSGLVTRYGGGRHMWDVQLETFFKMLYWVNISAIIYGFVVFFIKLSILLQYLRIFAPTRKGNLFIYVGVHLCIWISLIFYLVETVFEIVICIPREKIWNPLMPTGRCFSVDATFQATGIFNVVSDFAILMLPMPCVWRLRLPLKKKVLMTTIFATGFFACITSILRTYYTWKIVQSPDISYNMVRMGMWTYAELSTGIVIGCLPVIPKFFQHVGPKLSSTAFLMTSMFNKFSKVYKLSSGSKSNASDEKKKTRANESEKLRLPSFKNTFFTSSALFSRHTLHTDSDTNEHQQSMPPPLKTQEYTLLDEESALQRTDDLTTSSTNTAKKELGRMMVPVKVATRRDGLERGRRGGGV